MLKLEVFDNQQQLAELMSSEIAAKVSSATDDFVLGVATGNTMIPLYQALSKYSPLAISRGFALDEYVGLEENDSRCFGHYVRHSIEMPLGLRPGTILVPRVTGDLVIAAADFEAEIMKTPIDIQILGVGRNGHIGFNEPGSDPESKTRVVELDTDTRIDNGADFAGLAPEQAITQGIGTILAARAIYLVATGASKAPAIRKLLAAEIDELFPVTQLANHPNLRVFIDHELQQSL